MKVELLEDIEGVGKKGDLASLSVDTLDEYMYFKELRDSQKIKEV